MSKLDTEPVKCIFYNFSSPVCIRRLDYTTQLIAGGDCHRFILKTCELVYIKKGATNHINDYKF